MQVREIMTANPACCTPDSTLREVALMMEQNDCGCIPVVDGLGTMTPVGTITDRDIAIRAVAASLDPAAVKASDIMTTDIATLTPQASIEDCFNVMEDREIRRVLVVDEQGKCCGIVAQADVVQTALNPARTNKVIREISESAPSRNPGMSMGGRMRQFTGRSSSAGQSMMGSGALVPLLIGLGSGIGLMYLLNSRRNTSNYSRAGEMGSGYDSDFLNATNEENFGRYVDAEEEIEKRQHHLQERIETVRSESSLTASDAADTIDRQSDETITQRGRTAGQGS